MFINKSYNRSFNKSFIFNNNKCPKISRMIFDDKINNYYNNNYIIQFTLIKK